jgi:hypothetical protein
MLAVLLVQLRFSNGSAAARYGFSRFPLRTYRTARRNLRVLFERDKTCREILTRDFLAAYAEIVTDTEGAMARLVAHLAMRAVAALREKPSRFGYVLMALVLTVILFSAADFLPAPYDMTR